MAKKLNSYDLSRNWFNYTFDNPEKVKPIHTAIYFFAIEHCNRLGWKDKFGFPTTMVMEAIGVKSYNTYIKALYEIVDFGFINMIEKSKNQHSSNIIALSNNDKATDKALDKALAKHSIKQHESTIQSIDSIDKQETNKQGTIEQKEKPHTENDLDSNEKFLSWFNKVRTLYLEIPSNVNRLERDEKSNLNILKSSYSKEQFNLAMYNLCNNKWANESDNILPKHFLKPDNFVRYLNMEKKPMISRSKKKRLGWEI